MSEIEIDISLEMYYELNELARKNGQLLDDFVNDILKEYIEKYDKTSSNYGNEKRKKI